MGEVFRVEHRNRDRLATYDELLDDRLVQINRVLPRITAIVLTGIALREELGMKGKGLPA